MGEPIETRHRIVPETIDTPLDVFTSRTDAIESDAIAGEASLDSRVDALEALFPVTEAHISLSDVVTDNVSITKHGFAPKAPNDATKFLNGLGAYAVPAGGASIPPFVLPVTAGFAWVNQGTSTITDLAGVFSLLTAQTSGGRDVRARVKAAPATPYSITSMFLLETNVGASFPDCGLLWRDSVSGKMIRLCIVSQGGAQPVVFLSKETSPTVFSASYVLTFPEAYRLVAGMAVMSVPVWLRIEDDGVNRKSSISFDGQRWFLLHSVARADFITPDQIGFGVQPNATATAMRIFNWVEA